MTFKDILCRGIANPGAFVGFKGERSMTEWQADWMKKLPENLRPRNDEAERKIVADAVNEALGRILHPQTAMNVAWRVLITLRQYVIEQDVRSD